MILYRQPYCRLPLAVTLLYPPLPTSRLATGVKISNDKRQYRKAFLNTHSQGGNTGLSHVISTVTGYR